MITRQNNLIFIRFADPLCDMRPLNVSRTGSGRREAWTKSDNWDTVGLVWSGTKRVINLPNWSSRFNFDPHSTENHPFLRGTCLFNYSPSQLILPFVVQCGKVNFFLFSFESEEFLPISRFFESYNIMSSYVKLIQKYFLFQRKWIFPVSFVREEEERILSIFTITYNFI